MPPKAPAKPAAKKGPPGAIAALKAALDRQKAEEERLQREAEEEERRLREEERIAEAERRREEEEKKLMREEQKHQHKDGLKDRKRDDALLHLERMKAAGYVLPEIVRDEHGKAIVTPAAAAGAPKPKPKKPEPKHVDPLPAPLPVEEPGGLADDWEDMIVDETPAPAPAVAAEVPAAAASSSHDGSPTSVMSGETDFVTNLRSPILCVLGHVDAGKTSLLDRIRRTNVQGGEAGGITQQIGATFFPRDAIIAKTAELNEKYRYDLRVPGLLVIDTPGHESFTNLRSRGSSLCDISILVVDIMHGLQPQTREGLRLLRDRKCPFVVALNKVDRMLDWEPHENMDIEQSLSLQKAHVVQQFETRLSDVILQFAEEGFNAALYFKNTDVRKNISVVPTSSRTGEGISDLLLLMIELVQRFMEGKVSFKNELQCTVLEVKPVQGFGTTIDVVLVNGTLHEGDKIVVCGLNGPIVTTVRALLTPHPMKEMRVKGDYEHHRQIRAAMGVKISAPDLEEAVPGTPLFVISKPSEEAELRREVMRDFNSIMSSVHKAEVGVAVQSSTLGAMEALLSFLKDCKIPVSMIGLGPIHKKHIIPVIGMKDRAPKFAVMLAFDVHVTKEAEELAKRNGIQIFSASIIYHLFDSFKRYVDDFEARVLEKNRQTVVFPVILSDLRGIRNRDPIIVGATVERGQLHIGAPLCVMDMTVSPPTKTMIGRVIGIEKDRKEQTVARRGDDVAVKISPAETSTQFGRQVTETSKMESSISRQSIDSLKESFRHEMDEDDWLLIIEQKGRQGVL